MAAILLSNGNSNCCIPFPFLMSVDTFHANHMCAFVMSMLGPDCVYY